MGSQWHFKHGNSDTYDRPKHRLLCTGAHAGKTRNHTQWLRHTCRRHIFNEPTLSTLGAAKKSGRERQVRTLGGVKFVKATCGYA